MATSDADSASHPLTWCARARPLLLPLVPAALLLLPRPAAAWTVGSQLDYAGCHERITTAALRSARAAFATAPRIEPTRDEAALIDEVQFEPPSDFVSDLAAMSLLLGVRDNDLKGQDPLDSLKLVEVHGNPDTQDEHCIRSATDDGDNGNESALANCRAFIVERATEALAGLADDGTVDGTRRMVLPVYVSIAGHVRPSLPLFYVRIGQAMHALEDGFTHTYRNEDGSKVTFVTNWIDYVTGAKHVERRDGPPHLAPLDHCEGSDPLVKRNYHLAIEAATRFLGAALDPSMTAEQKVAAFEALTAEYLSYEPGCTIDNKYCDALEPDVKSTTGCNAATAESMSWLVLAALLLLARRRRSAIAPAVGAVILVGATTFSRPAHADDPPVTCPYGYTMMLGGSLVHGAADVAVGGRYRVSEAWLVGIDGEWNPWITSAPVSAKAGSANAYLTIIRRFPMKFERVNLRTSFHLGASMLLFDVNGAPKYDVGPFGSFSPLGIDYQLSGSTRLILDPVEMAVPMPHVGTIPLYYDQFRVMVGLQIGA